MNDDLNDRYQEGIVEHAKSLRNFRPASITDEPVREHLEQVLGARLEELIEKK